MNGEQVRGEDVLRLEISAFIDENRDWEQKLTVSPYKDLAVAVVKTECPACIFALIDGKAATPRDWLISLPTASVLRAIGADKI